jgi:hypothetical protein
LVAPMVAADESGTGFSGDAAETSAAIDAWLAERARAGTPDWDGCLSQIRGALGQLIAFPLIVDDPQAGAILEKMISAQDMEEFAAEVDRLSLRASELLQSKEDNGRRDDAVVNVTELASWKSQSRKSDPDADPIQLPGRMFLRL